MKWKSYRLYDDDRLEGLLWIFEQNRMSSEGRNIIKPSSNMVLPSGLAVYIDEKE